MSNEKTVTPITGYLMAALVFILLVIGIFGLVRMHNPMFIWILVTAIIAMPGFFFINPNGSMVLVLFGDYKGTVKRTDSIG